MNKRWSSAAGLAFCALLVAPGCDEHAEQRQHLTAVVARLDSCNDSGDGAGVLGVYSQESIAYYDTLVPIILDGTPEQVRALLPGYQVEVLMARLLGTRDEIEGLDGRGYVAFATGRGWYRVPEDLRTRDTLANFEFLDGEAWAEIISDGESTEDFLCFVLEGGEWKYDEPRTYNRGKTWWWDAASKDGVSLDDYVVMAVEYATEREVPASIWNPMPR